MRLRDAARSAAKATDCLRVPELRNPGISEPLDLALGIPALRHARAQLEEFSFGNADANVGVSWSCRIGPSELETLTRQSRPPARIHHLKRAHAIEGRAVTLRPHADIGFGLLELLGDNRRADVVRNRPHSRVIDVYGAGRAAMPIAGAKAEARIGRLILACADTFTARNCRWKFDPVIGDGRIPGLRASAARLGDYHRSGQDDSGNTGPRHARRPASERCLHGQAFIDSKNSPLFLVLRSLSSRKSMPSIVPIGLRMRRRMYIFLSCCASVSSSSLRVPERVMSIAGNVRLSATLRSRMISELPVPLNSSKITSSMRLPVSISAVAMMVSDPPSSILRAAPKNRFGRCRAFASTPPVSTLPDDGTTVL